jgi:hypothetical protein
MPERLCQVRVHRHCEERSDATLAANPSYGSREMRRLAL